MESPLTVRHHWVRHLTAQEAGNTKAVIPTSTKPISPRNAVVEHGVGGDGLANLIRRPRPSTHMSGAAAEPVRAVDRRARIQSKNLAPLSRRVSFPSSHDSVGERAALSVGSPVDHVLTPAGDNLVHTIEHMDTVFNAHASVLAEGIRPPLEKRNSALDGIKSLFGASSQVALPTLEDLLLVDVRPFSRMDRPHSDDGSRDSGSKIPDNRSTQAPGEDVQKERPETPPSQGSSPLSKSFSDRIRKVYPHEDKPSDRILSELASHSAHAQSPPPDDDVISVGSPSHEKRASPPQTPRKHSKTDSQSTVLSKRRSSILRLAEVARSASRLLEKVHAESKDERRQAKVAELMEKDVMVLNENQLAKMQQRSAHPFTLSVNSVFRSWWDFFIALCTAYVVIAAPVKVGFDVHASGFTYAVDAIIDLLYLSEIPLNMFTSYIDETTGEEVKPLKKIRHKYLYGYFVMDALGSFPSTFVNHKSGLLSLVTILKITRIYKLSRSNLFKTFSSRVNRSMNPSLLRMLELTLIFCLSQHFIACTYYFISLNQTHITSWQVPEDIKETTLIHQYVHALYFAIMVTTANDVCPTTTIEKLFTSVMLFVGIVINASIIGSAANLLSNLDKAEIARKNQMDSINDYMRFNKVPLKLQENIRRYYEYALNSRITDPTESLFAELPDRLKLSLRLSLHDEFIRKVPLFRVCSNAGVIAIVQCLHHVVAMPQEVVIAQEELANEFYFIRLGRVSLCVRLTHQEIPLGNLGEGSFFGESSLLTGEPQQAEVKSESISELAYLTKSDFLAIVDKFPTFYLAVRRISDNRMQTAHNVQRMTKMQRRQSHPHVPPMHRRSTLGKMAHSVLPGPRLRASMKSAGRLLSDSRRVTGGNVTPISPVVMQSEGDDRFHRLSQRFSSSRRNSASGLFSANYMETISLGQARHLSTLRSLEGLQIESSADDPLRN